MSSAVVSNSSPLIALEQLDLLDVLERIFGNVLVPPAVAKEVAPLDALLKHDFRVSPTLYDKILEDAGEGS